MNGPPEQRPVGLTRDVGWEIGVSATLDAPLEDVWDLMTSARGIALWLDDDLGSLPELREPFETPSGARGELRSLRPQDRIRLTWQPGDWDHESTVQLAVRDAGRGRTTLGFHQERLASAEERERQREHWRAVLGELTHAASPLRGSND